MAKAVVWRHAVVVDSEGARAHAALVLGGRVRAELPGEHVQDALAHPAPLSEGCESEVVRVHLAETWQQQYTYVQFYFIIIIFLLFIASI